jgi:hypothetical protein
VKAPQYQSKRLIVRDYSKVAPTFWTGETGRKIRACGTEALLVALHVMTCPHANMYGLYYLPIPFIAHETGISTEGASKALLRLFEGGFCLYDPPSEWVFVIEMAKYQILKDGEPLKQGDNRIKGINKDYANFPNNPFLFNFYTRYKDDFYLESARGETKSISPFEAPLKPLRSQEQEQEQEQDKEQDKPTPATRVQEQLPESFEARRSDLERLFPDINLDVAMAKLLIRKRDSTTLLDPYETILKWMQTEFKPAGGNNANSKGNTHNVGRGNSGRTSPSNGSEGTSLLDDEETIAFCSRDWPERNAM